MNAMQAIAEEVVELHVKLAFRDRRIAELDRLLESARSLATNYEARLALAGKDCHHITQLLGSALGAVTYAGMDGADAGDVETARDLALEISRFCRGEEEKT